MSIRDLLNVRLWMAQMSGRLNDQSAVRTLRLDDVMLTYLVDGSMTMIKEKFFASIPNEYWRDHPEAVTPSGRVAMSAGPVSYTHLTLPTN